MWKWIKEKIDFNIIYLLLALLVGIISGATLMKSDVQRVLVAVFGTDDHPENGLISKSITQEDMLKNINTNISRIDLNVRDINSKLDEVLMRKNANFAGK